MNIPIMLKAGALIPQPLTDKNWKYGILHGLQELSDGKKYAFVETEHGEFEYTDPMILRSLSPSDIADIYNKAIEDALNVIEGCFETGSYSHVEKLIKG